MSKLHWSQLRHIARSPWHYQEAKRRGVTETPAMRLGSFVDSLVFQRDNFVVYPGKVRRGKEWERFESDHQDREHIFIESEYRKATVIYEAVRDNPEAQRILDMTEWQRTVEWSFGRPCIGTPDMAGSGILADLKVSATADPMRFPWHAKRMGWHANLAWYHDGLVAAGDAFSEVYIVAVEANPYPCCTVFEVTEKTLEIGRRFYRSLLERLAVCERSGHWPAYAETFASFDLPDDDEPVTLEIDGNAVEFA